MVEFYSTKSNFQYKMTLPVNFGTMLYSICISALYLSMLPEMSWLQSDPIITISDLLNQFLQNLLPTKKIMQTLSQNLSYTGLAKQVFLSLSLRRLFCPPTLPTPPTLPLWLRQQDSLVIGQLLTARAN